MHWVRNSRRYGYIVDGGFYTSKVVALQAAGGDINRLRLYFLDDAWASVDYTQEPAMSWQELMDLRVRQIRDQYRYVILFFSGGYDSTTILNAFVRNRLPIDEIIIWEREWLPETRAESRYAFGIAKHLKDWVWKDLKVTYHLKTLKALADFYRESGENWVEHPGSHLGMQKNIRDWEFQNSHNSIHGMHELADTIIIEGREKPRLDFRDGKWYCMMNDKLLTYCMGNLCDQFYFSEDFPELYLKNCYMLIDWLETNFDVTHELVHQLQDVTKMSPEFYEQYNRVLGRDPVHLDSHRFGINKCFNTGGMITQLDSTRAADMLTQDHDSSAHVWRRSLHDITVCWRDAMQDDRTDFKTVVGARHYLRDYQPWKKQNRTESPAVSL